MSKRIVAIVGTYRRNRVIDSAVDELLSAARQEGAETEKIMLLDEPIEFCTNCRACTQTPGQERGHCPLNDGMENILTKLEAANGLVMASPINAGNVTALMKRFIERLVCYAYWPWGISKPPQMRLRKPTKPAVVITSSACPAFIGRWLMANPTKTLKGAAKCLGAKTAGTLHFGLAATSESDTLSEGNRLALQKQGIRLARML